MYSSSLLPFFAAVPSILSAPVQPLFTNTTTLPTRFGLLLFPHFQALDVFGPMDVFNTISMLYSNSTTMHLSILSRTLEPVSSAMPGMSGSGNFGQSIVPTITFDQYLLANNYSYADAVVNGTGSDDIEVLLVPGGGGTRQPLTSEIAFVKAIYPSLRYIISVCTGATLLSRAGVLDHRRATTNKRAWAWATSTGPNVTWVPMARWVEDGNIFSSSGVSAGSDVAYAWVARVYGEDVAQYISLSNEYRREVDAGRDEFAAVWDVPGAT